MGDTWRAWGSGGRAPSGVHGQRPWWRTRGKAPPPEAESLVACGRPMETAKLPHSLYFANSIHIGLLCVILFDVFRKAISNFVIIWVMHLTLLM